MLTVLAALHMKLHFHLPFLRKVPPWRNLFLGRAYRIRLSHVLGQTYFNQLIETKPTHSIQQRSLCTYTGTVRKHIFK
jgi:hypothetical protein